jgi:hypothetical protein
LNINRSLHEDGTNVCCLLFVVCCFLGCSNPTESPGNGGGGTADYTISLTDGGENTIILTLSGGAEWKDDVTSSKSDLMFKTYVFSWSKISGDVDTFHVEVNQKYTRVSGTELKIECVKRGSHTGTGTIKISTMILSPYYQAVLSGSSGLTTAPTGSTWSIGTNNPITITIN